MKIKNKIFTLLSVFTLVGLTHSLTLKDLNASLTAPADYDYFFRPIDNPSPAVDFWRLGDWNGTISPNGSNDLRFTRTPDSIYFNYSLTTNYSTHSFLPDGLEIIMTFNRSNTSWTQVSGTSLYNPTDYNKIGSDNTVGTLSSKLYLEFDNQTNKNYMLFIDLSSTNNSLNNSGFQIRYDDIYIIESSTTLIMFSFGLYLNLYLPAYTNIKYNTTSISQERYFDAWYLQDLGVSDAYDAGYDAGSINANENADLLVTGFTAMVGILVNFVLMIVNLEVLGVSILGIFSIILLFTTIVWVLKLIRG
jgi:hypothetical protein